MIRRAGLRASLAAGTLGLVAASWAAGEKQNTAAKADYTRDVQPILKASCYQCHGQEQQASGLRLDTKAAAFKGGVSGGAVVPGKPEQSRLLQRILGAGGKPRMPMGF